MGKTFTDASTTLAEANFNKLVAGDSSTGISANGICCFGGYCYWVSGTNFDISDYWGATNIYGDIVVTWDAVNNWVKLDFSGLTNKFKAASYGPCVQATQDNGITPRHIEAGSGPNSAVFEFYSIGASPAKITVPDSTMNFHWFVWGYMA